MRNQGNYRAVLLVVLRYKHFCLPSQITSSYAFFNKTTLISLDVTCFACKNRSRRNSFSDSICRIFTTRIEHKKKKENIIRNKSLPMEFYFNRNHCMLSLQQSNFQSYIIQSYFLAISWYIRIHNFFFTHKQAHTHSQHLSFFQKLIPNAICCSFLCWQYVKSEDGKIWWMEF